MGRPVRRSAESGSAFRHAGGPLLVPGPEPVDGHGLPALDATQGLRDVSVERIGSDIMIAGYPH